MTACTSLPNKIAPEYNSVDVKAKPLVDEYMSLSTQNNITFTHSVTVGFKNLKDNIAGICTYGAEWREIDIDLSYWNTITILGKTALIFHELSHCYCNRDHDYGPGKKYGSYEDRVSEVNKWQKTGGAKPGRYDEDSCPISLMYPAVVDDDCMKAHYNDYIKEMFDRCESY